MQREPQRLEQIIQQFLQEQGLGEIALRARLPKAWEAVVGVLAARVSRVRSFADGILVVEVSAATWRTELRLRAEELRQRLNRELGAEYVRELVIR
jgi:predicted nucleic acid-binding Zn ribbon protein